MSLAYIKERERERGVPKILILEAKTKWIGRKVRTYRRLGISKKHINGIKSVSKKFSQPQLTCVNHNCGKRQSQSSFPFTHATRSLIKLGKRNYNVTLSVPMDELNTDGFQISRSKQIREAVKM